MKFFYEIEFIQFLFLFIFSILEFSKNSRKKRCLKFGKFIHLIELKPIFTDLYTSIIKLSHAIKNALSYFFLTIVIQLTALTIVISETRTLIVKYAASNIYVIR